jgi:hypothetical protein
MKQLISGSYDSVTEANSIIDGLLDAGYQREEISVMMDQYRHTELAGDSEAMSSQNTRIVRDAAGGGLLGGALGAIIAGTLAASGAIGAAIITGGAAAPIIAGPLAAALAGGGAGAAAGGILGGLAGFGLSQEHSRKLMSDLESGKIIVAVRTDEEDADIARAVLHHEELIAL